MLHWIQPGPPDTRTGGFIYNRRIVEALGRPVALHCLPPRYPRPTPADLDAVDALLASIPDGAAVVIDGLAYGAIPGPAAAHGRRLRLIALVHHPLHLETGLDDAARSALAASERAALAHARLVVATSRLTVADVRRLGVAADRIAVVEPGCDPRPPAEGTGRPLRLLTVGSVVPRKGHDVLVRALASIADLDWRLDLLGSLTRAPECAAALRAQIAARDLDGRITLHGEAGDDDLAAAYRRADVFVLSSHHEGYGMVLAEAVSAALPIVATRGGAAAETVPDGAGILVPPGDDGALAAALRTMIEDDAARARHAAASAAARDRLPRWPDQAHRFAGLVDAVMGAP